MDEILELVQKVVRQCASRGVSVSDVLASFVVRTVIEKPGQSGQPLYSLDQPLTPEALNDLVDRSVDRLLEIDSPSLETIKMQVAFDSSYITEEEDLITFYQRRSTRLREMQRTIATMRPKDGADFDALTALHRQIFSYLLRHASDESKLGRGVEREVAAALESVFPRISLKAFINLGAEEKHAQLDELANIVLGIRVFNQHIGKGGVNIPNIEQEAVVLLRQLEVSLSEEVEKAQRICIDLQELIVRSHLQHPEGVTSHMLRRWKDELMNRRQYLSYLQSLQEDMAVSERKVCSLRGTITSEMGDLQELVGNRASVPKEHVYPKFYEIAAQWTGLSHEYKVIIGRTRTMEVLRMFCNSYTPTSHDGIELQGDVVTALEEDALAAEAAVSATMDGSVTTYPGQDPSMEVEAKTGDDASTPSIESNMLTIHDRAHAMLPPETTRRMDRPVKLSIESTPEFMQLPLEYQGFCSWTIVKRQGLLLPGKPELGVVRFKNRFFVFAHQVAINTFMEDPDCFVEGALQRAVLSPELIHLLRLQDSFPDKCITRILQGDTSRKLCPRAAGTVPEKYDASTGTPVHFVAKYFESGYHWNEWVHRRRALQVANLRSCVTKSQQTDVSHFRRANNTQVHLQRAKHTQTSRSNGSKPLQHVRYYAGVPSSQLSKLRRLNLSCARAYGHIRHSPTRSGRRRWHGQQTRVTKFFV